MISANFYAGNRRPYYGVNVATCKLQRYRVINYVFSWMRQLACIKFQLSISTHGSNTIATLVTNQPGRISISAATIIHQNRFNLFQRQTLAASRTYLPPSAALSIAFSKNTQTKCLQHHLRHIRTKKLSSATVAIKRPRRDRTVRPMSDRLRPSAKPNRRLAVTD